MLERWNAGMLECWNNGFSGMVPEINFVLRPFLDTSRQLSYFELSEFLTTQTTHEIQ